jgi:putative transposase
LIPEVKKGGRPRTTDIREVLNGIFYRLKNACSWENLPKDFPPHKTVSRYHREWSLDGTTEKLHAALRTLVRQKAGKAETPTAGIIDSQSVKTTEQGGARGYDAGKKVNGRKRHICVDTLGMMWARVVHEAGIQDRDGAKLVFWMLMRVLSSLLLVWADGGYAGPILQEWLKTQNWGWILEIVKRSDDTKGFKVLPHRWIVERTFGWWNSYRFLAKEYEHSTKSSESNLDLVMIHVMLRRLAA